MMGPLSYKYLGHCLILCPVSLHLLHLRVPLPSLKPISLCNRVLLGVPLEIRFIPRSGNKNGPACGGQYARLGMGESICVIVEHHADTYWLGQCTGSDMLLTCVSSSNLTVEGFDMYKSDFISQQLYSVDGKIA